MDHPLIRFVRLGLFLARTGTVLPPLHQTRDEETSLGTDILTMATIYFPVTAR